MNAVSIEVATARDANPSGVMFGGWLMQLADRIASVAASRYSGRRVATASVVNMRFVAPCYVGDFLTITAEVTSSATTSMTVAVRIDVEGVQGGQARSILEGSLVFVALSDSGTPVPINARDSGPVGQPPARPA
jgi:acyl-CoA thioesterase YciA